MSEPRPLRIARLRTEIAELSAAVRQLHKAGLDDAAAAVLLLRKRVELEGLLKPAGRPVERETHVRMADDRPPV